MSAAAVAVSPAARRLADRPAVAGANGEESFGITKANGSTALPPKADIDGRDCHVRFVLTGDKVH
jgi:hypothetical protein